VLADSRRENKCCMQQKRCVISVLREEHQIEAAAVDSPYIDKSCKVFTLRSKMVILAKLKEYNK
jgi:hypothetical protein